MRRTAANAPYSSPGRLVRRRREKGPSSAGRPYVHPRRCRTPRRSGIYALHNLLTPPSYDWSKIVGKDPIRFNCAALRCSPSRSCWRMWTSASRSLITGFCEDVADLPRDHYICAKRPEGLEPSRGKQLQRC